MTVGQALDVVKSKAIDLLNRSHVLDLERRIQGHFMARPDVAKVVQRVTAPATTAPPPAVSVSAPSMATTPPQRPIDVSGFYKVTGPTEATFYATTSWPGFNVGKGWNVVGLNGMIGTIQVVDSADVPGTAKTSSLVNEPYNWTFRFQSDTRQVVEGVQYSIGCFLYPPGQAQYPTQQRTGPIYGSYIVPPNGYPVFNFSAPPPQGTAIGWFVNGLPTVGAAEIIAFSEEQASGVDSTQMEYQAQLATQLGRAPPTAVSTYQATLKMLDGAPTVTNLIPVVVKGAPAIVSEPIYTTEFEPAMLVNSALDERAPVEINPNVIGGKGTPVPLRNLGEGIEDAPVAKEEYREVKDRGFSAGSVLSLFAVGPQDQFLTSNAYEKSNWSPKFRQHTNFVMYQRVIPFPSQPVYQGLTVQMELLPTQLGHLLSNMYFSCTIPAAGKDWLLNENIGRALIKQVDLLVNEQVIETLYDDWYVIRDQCFLDADEQKGMYSLVGGLNSNLPVSSNINVVCPLEFFFCRRHSHSNKGRERLRKPYFPLCAMWNQKLYVRFTFHPAAFWSSNASPGVDFINPKLVTEEILLDNSEKVYYANTPQRYIVNKVKKESTLAFTGGSPQLQLTANFPVQSLFWFFRNKNYESVTDATGAPSGLYYDSRYNYGYTTDYIRTGTPIAFPSSNNATNPFVDVIETAKVTLNNIDILSTFQGSLYYSFKQPMEHGLSIPSRNIYTYSFGLTPAEYNQGGFLNFSKLNSQTTSLSLSFVPGYATQIIQGYNLYMFYYGYTVLEFQNGFARLPFA
jgi:hypothetical protein